jgi:hypothetical protein
MKSSILKITLLLTLALSLCAPRLHGQDHGHLRTAAYGIGQGAQLHFYNGADFATTSRYVKTLVFTNSGRYSNYFQGNITLTVQAATANYGGPEPDAPALGSYIRARILSVNGPVGGAFGFWEAGATHPTISLFSGETGTNSFHVTQTDGSPGADPFGHIHGRRFTATKPGLYTVSFQTFDASTNGLSGGPIHAPSEIIGIYFQAGVNLQFIEPDEDHTHVHFAAPAGFSWQVEASNTLAPQAHWTPVGNSVRGDDYLHEVLDPQPVQGSRFYRLMGVAP